MRTKLAKLRRWLGERGPAWTTLYAGHWITARVLHCLETWLIAIEQTQFLTGEGTIASMRHTATDNQQRWDAYDWSQGGEEWTQDVRKFRDLPPEAWKTALIERMMKLRIRPGSTVLEIGPGAGRWTETLQQLAGELHLADISQKCLTICRERFRDRPHIAYHLIGRDGLAMLAAASIDAIWSYDVFVHINPTDVARYLADFERILKPGGVAVIHHSGRYRSKTEADDAFRSPLDGRFFAHLVEKNGFRLVEQNTELPHMRGDVITVFEKPR